MPRFKINYLTVVWYEENRYFFKFKYTILYEYIVLLYYSILAKVLNITYLKYPVSAWTVNYFFLNGVFSSI